MAQANNNQAQASMQPSDSPQPESGNMGLKNIYLTYGKSGKRLDCREKFQVNYTAFANICRSVQMETGIRPITDNLKKWFGQHTDAVHPPFQGEKARMAFYRIAWGVKQDFNSRLIKPLYVRHDAEGNKIQNTKILDIDLWTLRQLISRVRPKNQCFYVESLEDQFRKSGKINAANFARGPIEKAFTKLAWDLRDQKQNEVPRKETIDRSTLYVADGYIWYYATDNKGGSRWVNSGEKATEKQMATLPITERRNNRKFAYPQGHPIRKHWNDAEGGYYPDKVYFFCVNGQRHYREGNPGLYVQEPNGCVVMKDGKPYLKSDYEEAQRKAREAKRAQKEAEEAARLKSEAEAQERMMQAEAEQREREAREAQEEAERQRKEEEARKAREAAAEAERKRKEAERENARKQQEAVVKEEEAKDEIRKQGLTPAVITKAGGTNRAMRPDDGVRPIEEPDFPYTPTPPRPRPNPIPEPDKENDMPKNQPGGTMPTSVPNSGNDFSHLLPEEHPHPGPTTTNVPDAITPLPPPTVKKAGFGNRLLMAGVIIGGLALILKPSKSKRKR